MCLISKTFFPKVAENDITCYKMLSVDWFECKPKFYTPFMVENCTEEVNTLKYFHPSTFSKIKNFFEYINPFRIIRFFTGGGFCVSGGYVHSYAEYSEPRYSGVVYFKCRIPKGSLYYVQNYEHCCEDKNTVDEPLCYASRVLFIDDDELKEKIEASRPQFVEKKGHNKKSNKKKKKHNKNQKSKKNK